MNEFLAKFIALWLAQMSPEGTAQAEFLRAHDGDSMTVGFACTGPVTATISFSGLSMVQAAANPKPLTLTVPCTRGTVPLTVRVAGVDTPELKSSCDTPAQRDAEKKRGYAVRDAVTGWLRRSGTVELGDLDVVSEKWGRTLATVRFRDDAGYTDLGTRLILSGGAKAYSGGTKQPFCNLP